MLETPKMEVTIPAGATFPATPAFAMLPSGATRGVVVIHEIFGRQPEIDRVVERFAARGYAAVEPDLFSAPSAIGCIRRTMTAMNTGAGPAVDQANAVRAWLATNANLDTAKIGIIGFCFGGGFALAVGKGWGAVSTNYGHPPNNDEVLRGLGPTFGCYGSRDNTMKSIPAKLAASFAKVGVPYESRVYDGVGHSFLTDGHHPIATALSWPMYHVTWNPDVAERAWTDIMAFFDAHLA